MNRTAITSAEGLDREVECVMGRLDAKPNDLERYLYLIVLSDRNETLFCRAVNADPARFVPMLYDPTVIDEITDLAKIKLSRRT